MRIFLTFLLLHMITLNASSQEIKENILENPVYIQRTTYFKEHPLEKGQIVFLGNSLTQHGKWDEYFPEQHPVNRGIAGDNTEGIMARLDEIIKAQPKKLFILTGVNDISLNRSADKIAQNMAVIIRQIKTESPHTAIYLQSLLPINKDVLKYKRLENKEREIVLLNKKLKKLSQKEHLTFIDLYPLFLSGKDKLNPSYTSDGLHINEEGYKVWCNKIHTFVTN